MEIGTKKTDMKHVIAIAAAAAIGSIIGGYIINGFSGRNNIFDKSLIQAANQINQNLPMMLDSDTRLDSTMAFPGKIFSYYNTIINYTVDQIDIEAFENLVRPKLINNVKTNSDMDDLRKNEVTLNYVYRDKDGIEITQIKITSNDYK
jgi:hypothetical protein